MPVRDPWYFDSNAPSSIAQPAANNLPSKQNEKEDLREKFCDVTTFHGIRYFAGREEPILGRLVWALVSAVSFAFCCVTLYPQFLSYIDGEVRTTMLLETTDEIPFPSLTICNSNQYRRSIIGPNKATVSEFLLQTGWSQKDAFDQCYDPNNTNSFLKDFDLSLFFNKFGTAAFFFSATDSFQSVIRCQHNGQDCSKNIINHMTDYGFCFTYNPGDRYRTNGTREYFMSDNDWVLTYPAVLGNPVVMQTAGPNGALELILNARQFDACDVGGQSAQTAGFQMLVHDPELDPLFMLESGVQLAPGFKTDVAVTVKKYDRETENLKRCSSNVQLDYYTQAKYYQLGACYLECIIKQINRKCGCLPYFMPLEAAEYLKDMVEADPAFDIRNYVCTGSNRTECFRRVAINATQNYPLQQSCPQCATPCKETMYIVEQASVAAFPAENVAFRFMNKKYTDFVNPNSSIWAHLKNDPSFTMLRAIYNANFSNNENFTDIQELKNNILAVKVYIKSMTIEMVIEEPLMSIEDLASQLGGASGLFLGASVLSFFEILYWMIYACFAAKSSQAADPIVIAQQNRKMSNKIASLSSGDRNNSAPVIGRTNGKTFTPPPPYYNAERQSTDNFRRHASSPQVDKIF